MKIIHLTDTHLIEPGYLLYGLDPALRLKQAIQSINEHHADADKVIITGDLTHWGQISAYETLRECIGTLIPECTLLLGNHDNREIFRDIFPDALQDNFGFVQGCVETEQGVFIYLDTNQPGTHVGWYCDQRFEWLNEQLDQYAGQNKFIFMHHPPFLIGLEPMDRISLLQKDKFLGALEKHKTSVRHIFFGHVHRPISGNWQGISFSTLRATSHQVWLDFTEKGEIPGSHEPPAYSVVLIKDESVVVHTHDFLDDSKKFSLGALDALTLKEITDV